MQPARVMSNSSIVVTAASARPNINGQLCTIFRALRRLLRNEPPIIPREVAANTNPYCCGRSPITSIKKSEEPLIYANKDPNAAEPDQRSRSLA